MLANKGFQNWLDNQGSPLNEPDATSLSQSENQDNGMMLVSK